MFQPSILSSIHARRDNTFAPYVSIETGCTLYIHAYVRVGPVHKVRTFHSRCKNRRVNRGKNTPAFFASLSRSCRHGIENYPPPLRPSLRALRSSLLILSCLHFRERLFLLVVDPSVRSFFPFLFQYGDLLLTFLFSRNDTASMPDFSLFFSAKSNNRLRHSFFFPPSSMNLCVQRLCKKRGRQGKKKKGKEYRVFSKTKRLAYRNSMHLIRSLFLFSSSSLSSFSSSTRA